MKKKQTHNLIPRPPIVVVVGHIDHGKTTLLDYIRRSNLAEQESGSITQHIGAHEVMVSTKNGNAGKITFLDTPGHEAFSAMRSRGAKIADVAVLVVAADDGVKLQTEEAIRVIQEARIPFVVALNKIDKENTNPERVKTELAEHGVFIEGHGGTVPSVSVSAKIGTGIDDLLETILLVAELEDLKADTHAQASGIVIESNRDAQRGNAATLVIQNGTLHRGDVVVVKNILAPVRIFEDYSGHSLHEATFSAPIRIVGFNALPPIGETFTSFSSKKEAEKALLRAGTEQITIPGEGQRRETTKKSAQQTTIPVILKADVAGSLEALESEVNKFASDKVAITIVRSEVGIVEENDLKLAASIHGVIIIAFRTGINKDIIEPLQRSGAVFEIFDVIYRVHDWLKLEIEKRLPAEVTMTTLGRAKILKIFKQTGSKQIIGGRVIDGTVKSAAQFHAFRNNNKIGEGSIVELQHGKIKVSEVEKDQEFGLLVSAAVSIMPGDVLEIFTKETVKTTL